MLRSFQIWVPALTFLGAVGIGSIALTMERELPPVTPIVTAANIAAGPALLEQASVPVKADVPADPPGPTPAGILTYVTGDGSYVTVDVADPRAYLEVTDSLDQDAGGAAASGVYRSPDGQYEAVVRVDDQGTWLDLRSGDRLIDVYVIAGPDDPDAVSGGKSLARAVEGVPFVIAWSPDSEHLAFGSVTGAPWSLAVIRARTGGRTWREVAGGYVGELAWAPDSSQLAISTYEIGRTNHTVLMYNPANASVRHLIDGCAIVWAPDAGFLAVHREPTVESGVWITSPDGATLIRATDDALAFPLSWTERAS